ncbi:MAG: alpha/beta hydrolase [Candidatus Omnitrophota bacterium]
MVLKGYAHIFSAVITFVLIFVYLRYIEKKSLFYPENEIVYTPEASGMRYNEVNFETSDGYMLNGWLIIQPAAKYTVLFAHGNAGNISHRIEKLKFFKQIGCNVFIFDYRGYGRSQGRPSEKGLYLDAGAAYEYLVAQGITANTIIGYGESLGGAVIIDAASKNTMAALIVDSSFSSAKDMIKAIYPFLPHWIFASKFYSSWKIKNINIPKLIIHSINDEIIPYRLGRKLYDEAAPPKEFLDIRGGHNSNFFESEDILKERISAFLKGLPQ